MKNKTALRNLMRKKRLALSDSEKSHASSGLCSTLSTQSWFSTAENIALYLANDGEIDPCLIQQEIWQLNKKCFLPALHPERKRTLQFAHFTPTTPLINNRFNIPEPDRSMWDPLNPEHLDVVLLPLVAFDKSGARLGMGGGFYDTTFAFKKNSNTCCKPLMIGLAHSFQEVERLEVDSWDIPLDGIVTEQYCLKF